jgi:hypothetical protein
MLDLINGQSRTIPVNFHLIKCENMAYYYFGTISAIDNYISLKIQRYVSLAKKYLFSKTRVIIQKPPLAQTLQSVFPENTLYLLPF